MQWVYDFHIPAYLQCTLSYQKNVIFALLVTTYTYVLVSHKNNNLYPPTERRCHMYRIVLPGNIWCKVTVGTSTGLRAGGQFVDALKKSKVWLTEEAKLLILSRFFETRMECYTQNCPLVLVTPWSLGMRGTVYYENFLVQARKSNYVHCFYEIAPQFALQASKDVRVDGTLLFGMNQISKDGKDMIFNVQRNGEFLRLDAEIAAYDKEIPDNQACIFIQG